jgi:SAM-dependent methyltransferase
MVGMTGTIEFSPDDRHPRGDGDPADYRLYEDLAAWWPLISPPAEYAGEAAYLAELLGGAVPPVREVLDLGSGGGHVAVHLKDRFSMTLLDISPQMLAVSQRLNPECAHLPGDMRTARLGRTFDAVLVHDAVDYMTSQADLQLVIETAFAHCRPGGLALFVPDHVADTFSPGNGHGGGNGPDGRQASFREWTWDPDPADDWIEAAYEFTLREPGGTAQVVYESHRLGAFSRATWRRLITAAGFAADPEEAAPAGAGRPRNLFVGRRA